MIRSLRRAGHFDQVFRGVSGVGILAHALREESRTGNAVAGNGQNQESRQASTLVTSGIQIGNKFALQSDDHVFKDQPPFFQPANS